MNDSISVARGLFSHPIFKGEPATLRSAFLWLACTARILRVTVRDLAEQWNVTERRAVQIVNKLEKRGLIKLGGSGKCRVIFVASDMVQTCGFYVGTRASHAAGAGAAKWRGAALPSKVRAAVLARDGHQCCYCGAAGVPLHVDHIKPVALGGRDDLSNLCAACVSCNLRKGAKSLDAWLGGQQ